MFTIASLNLRFLSSRFIKTKVNIILKRCILIIVLYATISSDLFVN